MIETDYLFVKPVVAPGPAQSPVRAQAYWFSYVYADAPSVKVGGCGGGRRGWQALHLMHFIKLTNS